MTIGKVKKEEMVSVADDQEMMEEVVAETKEDSEYLNMEIFAGGPTRGQIENWKTIYGDVFSSGFDDDVFIWRCLNRTEYKKILGIASRGDAQAVEEKICSTCVLWPDKYDAVTMASGKAGIPQILSEYILAKSGFVPTDEPIKL